MIRTTANAGKIPPKDLPQPDVRVPSAVFRQRVKEVRRKRGWSQQDLADELARQGIEIDRSQIARTESGPRVITVDDLLAFASALDVYPVSLLVPKSDGEAVLMPDGREEMLPIQVAVTPTQPVLAEQVRGWIRGNQPLRRNPEALRFYEEELSNREVFARRHPELVRLDMYVDEMRSALLEDDGEWVDRVLSLLAEEVAAQQRARELTRRREASKQPRRKG